MQSLGADLVTDGPYFDQGDDHLTLVFFPPAYLFSVFPLHPLIQQPNGILPMVTSVMDKLIQDVCLFSLAPLSIAGANCLQQFSLAVPGH